MIKYILEDLEIANEIKCYQGKAKEIKAIEKSIRRNISKNFECDLYFEQAQKLYNYDDIYILSIDGIFVEVNKIDNISDIITDKFIIKSWR